MKYAALIDGEVGAYGAVFPDLPGCVAMGFTKDEVVCNADDAMRDWIAGMEAIAVPSGATRSLPFRWSESCGRGVFA